MSTADTYVRARIDSNTKERAADALEAMGLSISDAIRLLMLRVADERRLPFDVKVPNATTRKAIAELEAGKGKRFASVDDLMAHDPCRIDQEEAAERDPVGQQHVQDAIVGGNIELATDERQFIFLRLVQIICVSKVAARILHVAVKHPLEDALVLAKARDLEPRGHHLLGLAARVQAGGLDPEDPE